MKNTFELDADLEPLLATIDQQEKRVLQTEVIKQLTAYFRAVYEVLHVEHPSSHGSIIVWMTKDMKFPTNMFQGPIPLLFEVPSEYIEYDYREFNDERGGVRSHSTKEINPQLHTILHLSTEELTFLIQSIDARMSMLADRVHIAHIAQELSQWEKAVGYDKSMYVTESSRHNNAEALYRLGQLYFQYVNQKD